MKRKKYYLKQFIFMYLIVPRMYNVSVVHRNHLLERYSKSCSDNEFKKRKVEIYRIPNGDKVLVKITRLLFFSEMSASTSSTRTS